MPSRSLRVAGNKLNIRYLAVTAKGEKPAIFVFDTTSNKRKKTLLGDHNIQDFIAVQFIKGFENQKLISLVNRFHYDLNLTDSIFESFNQINLSN